MKKLTSMLAVLALAFGAGAACTDKDDDRDDTESVERKAEELGRDVEGAADRAADKVEGAADRATAPAADNTDINERDRADGAKTAQSADGDQSDVDIMAKIRKRVVDHDDLGTNAKNVKIIAEDGKVILRGPVASADERAAIETIARDVAGGGNVVNELEVAP